VGIVLEVGYIVAVAVGYIQLLAIDSFVDHSFVVVALVVALVVGIALVEDIVVALAFALAFALASALAFALASALAFALAFALALAFGKRVVLGIEVSSLVDI